MPDMLKTYQDLVDERDAVVKQLPALQAIRDAAVANYTDAYERSLTLTRMIKDMVSGVVEVKASVEKKADPAPVEPPPVK